MLEGVRQRVLTALALAPALIAAVVFLPPPLFSLMFALLLVPASLEMGALAALDAPQRRVYAAAIALAMLAVSLTPGWQPAVLGACAAAWLPLAAWLAWPGWGAALWGRPVKLAAGVVIIAGFWLALGLIETRGPGYTLALLAVIWAADTGAYFTGKAIGHHPLAPRLSPGKTIEGLAGGLLAAALVAILIIRLAGPRLPSPGWVVLIAVGIAAISVTGDLFVSLLKRQAGVKDSGSLLPGHGGLLDRIDSLAAAAPFYALAVLAAP